MRSRIGIDLITNLCSIDRKCFDCITFFFFQTINDITTLLVYLLVSECTSCFFFFPFFSILNFVIKFITKFRILFWWKIVRNDDGMRNCGRDR